MKLPWLRATQNDRLVVALTPDSFAYVHAQAGATLPLSVEQWGLELRGADSAAEFARRVRALGLPRRQVCAMLSLPQYQWLQIETPAVSREELKAAARWHIKDMIDTHLDDVTLDVLHVGDDRQRTPQHLFVVAAANGAIQQAITLASACGLQLSVIDVRETAQRNLQTALAAIAGVAARATAALTVHGAQCLLTISARDELFYTRRLDWDPRIVERVLVDPRTSTQLVRPTAYDDAAAYSLGTSHLSELVGEVDNDPSLMIELQRSFDVWERTWPELPLAGLSVQAPQHAGEIAALLQRELGLHAERLNTERLFSGFEADHEQDAAHAACLPLLGALLRAEQRKL